MLKPISELVIGGARRNAQQSVSWHTVVCNGCLDVGRARADGEAAGRVLGDERPVRLKAGLAPLMRVGAW